MAIYKRVCRECGREFEGGPRAWYCPECRYYRARERAAKYRKNHFKRKIGSKDVCERCGKEYTVNSGLQRYCPKCAPIVAKETDRRLSLEYYSKNKEKINPQRYLKRRKFPEGMKIYRTSSTTIWTLEDKNGKAYTTSSIKQLIAEQIAPGSDETTINKIQRRLYDMWGGRIKKNYDRNYLGWKIVDKRKK